MLQDDHAEKRRQDADAHEDFTATFRAHLLAPGVDVNAHELAQWSGWALAPQ